MKEIYSSANGLLSETSSYHGGDDGDDVQCIEQQGSNGLQCSSSKLKEGEYEDFSPEHTSAHPSSETTNINIQSEGSSPNILVAESLFKLQTAKEALENELMKFREIRNDIFVNDVSQDLPPEFPDIDQTFKQFTSEFLQSGEVEQEFSFASRSVLDNRDVEADAEELFMRKIEADVEYLTFHLIIKNLKVAALDQIFILEEQKALVLKETQSLQKLGYTKKKALLLNTEAKKLENIHEEISFADEIWKIQMRLVKYTAYFFLQLTGLMIVLGMSPKYADVLPT